LEKITAVELLTHVLVVVYTTHCRNNWKWKINTFTDIALILLFTIFSTQRLHLLSKKHEAFCSI